MTLVQWHTVNLRHCSGGARCQLRCYPQRTLFTPVQGSEDTDAYTCPPRPPYMQSNTSLRPTFVCEGEELVQEPLDTCYHLLQLYSGGGHSLEQVLSPESSTSDLMDYRLR